MAWSAIFTQTCSAAWRAPFALPCAALSHVFSRPFFTSAESCVARPTDCLQDCAALFAAPVGTDCVALPLELAVLVLLLPLELLLLLLLPQPATSSSAVRARASEAYQRRAIGGILTAAFSARESGCECAGGADAEIRPPGARCRAPGPRSPPAGAFRVARA